MPPRPAPDEPALITELVKRNLGNAPRATAVECGEHRLSWRELDQRIRHVASGLRAARVHPGERFAVLSHNHPACIEAYVQAHHEAEDYDLDYHHDNDKADDHGTDDHGTDDHGPEDHHIKDDDVGLNNDDLHGTTDFHHDHGDEVCRFGGCGALHGGRESRSRSCRAS